MKDLVEALEKVYSLADHIADEQTYTEQRIAEETESALVLARGYAASVDMLHETIAGNIQHSIGEWVRAQIGAAEKRAEKSLADRNFDGFAQEILRAQHVRPFDWNVGTAVECNWKRKGKYFPGKITTVSGATDVHIAYDDGDREDTNIALCRSR